MKSQCFISIFRHFTSFSEFQLPDFVESNFMPSNEQQIDDITAANLATQLLGQLEAKIAQIPNDPDKYMSKTKLSEMYDNLKVCNKQVRY